MKYLFVLLFSFPLMIQANPVGASAVSENKLWDTEIENLSAKIKQVLAYEDFQEILLDLIELSQEILEQKEGLSPQAKMQLIRKIPSLFFQFQRKSRGETALQRISSLANQEFLKRISELQESDVGSFFSSLKVATREGDVSLADLSPHQRLLFSIVDARTYAELDAVLIELIDYADDILKQKKGAQFMEKIGQLFERYNLAVSTAALEIPEGGLQFIRSGNAVKPIKPDSNEITALRKESTLNEVDVKDLKARSIEASNEFFHSITQP